MCEMEPTDEKWPLSGEWINGCLENKGEDKGSLLLSGTKGHVVSEEILKEKSAVISREVSSSLLFMCLFAGLLYSMCFANVANDLGILPFIFCEIRNKTPGIY